MAGPRIRDLRRSAVAAGRQVAENGDCVYLNSLWPDYQPGIISIERYRYEPSGETYNLYFEQPSTDPATREIVMYNPRGEQDFSSHVFDLLQLSPEQIQQQRGYFASQALAQAKWRRFLFD